MDRLDSLLSGGVLLPRNPDSGRLATASMTGTRPALRQARPALVISINRSRRVHEGALFRVVVVVRVRRKRTANEREEQLFFLLLIRL